VAEIAQWCVRQGGDLGDAMEYIDAHEHQSQVPYFIWNFR
jgi:hypothetical protein